MEDVYKYKVYCPTCSSYYNLIREESQGVPTKCPLTHEINYCVIVDKIIQTIVKTQQQDRYLTKDNGIKPNIDGDYIININQGDNESSLEISFSYDVDIMCGLLKYSSFNDGDKIDIYATKKDGILTKLTQIANLGDNFIHVEKAYIDMLRNGDVIIIGSEEKRINGINIDNSKLILNENLENNYSIDTTISVRFYGIYRCIIFEEIEKLCSEIKDKPLPVPSTDKIIVRIIHVTQPSISKKAYLRLVYYS